MLRGETQTLEMNDGTDGFSFMHQIEGRIDVFERHGVGYERRKFDIATHGIFDHAGKLAASLTPPKAEPRHERPVTSWKGRVEIS